MNSKYFIETLQPIKQYGKDGKSVVFVQGRLDGNGGEKVSTTTYWNGSDADLGRIDGQGSYIDKGEVVEQGSHSELLAEKGLYHRLIEMQTFKD